MSERYILKWVIESETFAAPYITQREAFLKAGELFDEHGPDLEIELHLNRLSPPPTVLFNARWMRDWNKGGRRPVQE